MALPVINEQNRLLTIIPAGAFDRLLPHLQKVRLKLGDLLQEPHRETAYVYFPTTAIISLVYMLESGASAEVGSVGREGMVGISHLLGGGTALSFAVVRAAGHGYQLDANILKTEFTHCEPLRRLMLRYMQVVYTQVAQTAVCNRGHAIDQQLCRWLLSTLDRTMSNELVVTQELVASALGVRREGITEAAGRLQRADIIRYRRGHISVIDRAALEARCCECYAVVKRELARLLPDEPLR